MQKKVTITIIVVLLMIAVIVGSTYAYFSGAAASNNSTVTANAEKYEVIYHGGTDIDCDLKMLPSHVGADNTTVEIGLGSDVNVSITATIYMTITSISPEIATSAFKWEVYRINGNNEILENQGTFNGKTNNSEVVFLNKAITPTLTSYKIYFWLDGSASGNEIMGSAFSGTIGARSDILTGIVDNT